MIVSWQVYPAIILALLIAYALHAWDVSIIEAKQTKAIAEQVTFDITKCEASKQITAKSEQDYETEIAKRDADIAALKLRYGTCAIMPVAKPTRISHATNQPDKPSKPDGILISSLLDYADQCETDRIKVMTLQGFITDERKQ